MGKIATDWTDAWNRHDAEGMAGVFSVRGDIINPMGNVAKGHEQILKLFQDEQAGPLKQSKMALTCEPARFFSASVAQVDCEFALDGLAEPQGAQLRGHVTNVVTREGERWRIVSQRAMVPRLAGPPAKSAVPVTPATPR